MAISDLFRRKDEKEPVDASPRSLTFPTKALPKLLATLKAREQPVLLDLGPVVGPNVTFFGEQLGCKVFIEDLFSDIDRHVRNRTEGELAAFLATRFALVDNSVDGILAWDVFDYLDKAAGRALASQLVRVLRPEGVILVFFAAEPSPQGRQHYTKRTVVNETTLSHREYPATKGKHAPILNRDAIRMFEPLQVTEQFLLKTHVREMLFKKPAA